jgi:hypothetical protein
MKPSSQPPRTTSKLSDPVHRQLSQYALAATAAGVGMLASAPETEGKIIYKPDHRYVLLKEKLKLDLNGDRIADFYINRYRGPFFSSYGNSYTGTGIRASGVARNNGMAGYRTGANGSGWAANALDAGKQISAALFSGGGLSRSGFMGGRTSPRGVQYEYQCNGPWNHAKNRYLGLKFEIKKEVHYGWARVNESCNRNAPKREGARALLTGYAYETVANKPIITGKTSSPDVITLPTGSLGALAAGASQHNRIR